MNALPQEASNGATLDAESRQQLSALLERGPEIEYLLDSFGQWLKRSPDIADNVNRAIGDVRDRTGGDAGGFDRLARTIGQLERLSESPSFQLLLERLQDERTASSLEGILDQLERVTALLESLERLLVRAPQIADNLNGLVQQLREQYTGRTVEAVRELGTIDPRQLVKLLNDLFAVVESPQTRALLGSSVFLDRSVALVDEAANSALQATRDAAASQRTTSLFGLLAVLKDPDVQRSLQFGIAFARRFGQKLDTGRPA
jgi:uncharacterized protein YjgD (DUF1641 family)